MITSTGIPAARWSVRRQPPSSRWGKRSMQSDWHGVPSKGHLICFMRCSSFRALRPTNQGFMRIFRCVYSRVQISCVSSIKKTIFLLTVEHSTHSHTSGKTGLLIPKNEHFGIGGARAPGGAFALYRAEVLHLTFEVGHTLGKLAIAGAPRLV